MCAAQNCSTTKVNDQTHENCWHFNHTPFVICIRMQFFLVCIDILNQFLLVFAQQQFLQSRVSFMLTISHSSILRIFALAYKTVHRFSIHLLSILAFTADCYWNDYNNSQWIPVFNWLSFLIVRLLLLTDWRNFDFNELFCVRNYGSDFHRKCKWLVGIL